MNKIKRTLRSRSSKNSPRKRKNTFVTKSGQTIKIHRSLTERFQASRDERARRKAKRLAGMPKSRIKRFFFRMHPKRLYKYWFSREGAIMALKLTGIGIVAGFLLLVGLFAYFRKDLPNLRDISGNNIGGSIRYYDRTGENLLWEDYDAVKRIPVHDENISQYMKDATIAIEDKDFFKHGGFDVRGISRAAWNNAFGSGGVTQGGSTITQQLVKLTQNWTNERTYTRKIKELILAVELERSYSKQEILVGYLNTAPYADITYGVEAAAQDYFNKSAKDLTLDEAAFLAAMPQSPSTYSPYGARYDKGALVGRQHYILDQMVEQHMISGEERDEAKEIDTTKKIKKRKPKYDGIKAPWFVLAAKEELVESRGSETVQLGGWKVITTLDMKAQKLAEEQVEQGMAQVRRQGGDVAAFVAEDVKTGQVVALVGGSDFNNEKYGQNNYARAKLPPGSSFKPYDYISLIENTDDFGAGSVLYDTQGPLDGYPCTNRSRPPSGNCLWNYDFRYPGPLTLRYALGGSRNVPAVKAMLIAGIDKTIETAEKLGLESGYNCYTDDALTNEGPCYASSGIGDGAYLKLDEHVHGYATISRNGNKIPQTYILKIEDSAGQLVDEWEPTEGEQVVRPDSAYIVADMMSDPRASYLGIKSHNYNGHKFGLKTGTTNDSKDGWMMGISTHYAAGVWVGYHNRTRAFNGFMETMTQPILTGWMNNMHNGLKPEERKRPSGVQELPAFVVRSHVGLSSIEPSPSKDLYPSWYKKKSSSGKQTIDIVSNKLATDCTPSRARKEVSGSDPNNFSGDTFVNRGAANTSQKDDVHKCDDKKPSIQLGTPESIGGGRYKITATVGQGTHPLNSERFPGTVNFIVGSQTVRSVKVTSPGSVSFNYTPDFNGTRTLKAEVIDSVLYEDSDSKQITGSGGGGSLTITGANAGGGNTIFTWNGGAGRVAIIRRDNGVEVCGSVSKSCNADNDDLGGATSVYAKDEDGNESDDFNLQWP